jgi:hypothetical protein
MNVAYGTAGPLGLQVQRPGEAVEEPLRGAKHHRRDTIGREPSSPASRWPGISAVLTDNSARKLGHGLVALVALWSLVAALAFSGTLLTWLVFGDALAVAAIALTDLTAHEATTEKVVHQRVVHDATTGQRAEQRAAA